MMHVSIVVFPGSNCDHDVEHVYGQLLGCATSLIWHRNADLKNPDLVILPGGFSYGDYLRTGAMAKLSPAMKAVSKYAAGGGRVLGICNGFQILCEAGLLPGALLRNKNCQFLSQFVTMRIEATDTFLTRQSETGALITCPIAHGDGNYYADDATIKKLEEQKQVIFRYVTRDGEITAESNPNGSLRNIAGICNDGRNVIGLMPHPERASESMVGWLGKSSGLALFESTLQAA